MQRVNVKQFDLEFNNVLSNRPATDFIVIHHTGSGQDIDAGVATIHQWHLANGWAGIGYHYVIRKDGTIEEGRPHWTIGSHCFGQNSNSIGLHISGDFTNAYPTNEQIEACAMLLANICSDYGLPIDNQHIYGHRDFNNTDCPGDNLYNALPTIIGKANWYANN